MSSDVAIYKGHKYKLMWMGQTKFGRRAKLAYLDGSKEFWVNAEAITIQTSEQCRRKREDNQCEVCGKNKYTCGHCVGW